MLCTVSCSPHTVCRSEVLSAFSLLRCALWLTACHLLYLCVPFTVQLVLTFNRTGLQYNMRHQCVSLFPNWHIGLSWWGRNTSVTITFKNNTTHPYRFQLLWLVKIEAVQGATNSKVRKKSIKFSLQMPTQS